MRVSDMEAILRKHQTETDDKITKIGSEVHHLGKQMEMSKK